jgi:malic enzyme
MAFDWHERDRFGLRGLLPPVVQTIEHRVERNMEIIRSCDNDFQRNQHLCSLQNRNETLFHRLLVDHIEEVVPWVYTPTY